METTSHVLVVEDDPAVRDVVRRYLERDGHRVTTAADGESGLMLARSGAPDLVVLDLMLGGIDGVEVCRRLRADDVQVPIVMLTALADEDHRIAGLSVGADDYVTKPFSVKELALRVQAVLRRVRGPEIAAPPVTDGGTGPLRDGGLVLDPASREVRRGDERLALTVREFDLLAYFLAHPGQVFSRTELLAEVWGWRFGDHSTVTVHVKRLRHKIERDPANPQRIVTVYGVGYRYDPVEEVADD